MAVESRTAAQEVGGSIPIMDNTESTMEELRMRYLRICCMDLLHIWRGAYVPNPLHVCKRVLAREIMMTNNQSYEICKWGVDAGNATHAPQATLRLKTKMAAKNKNPNDVGRRRGSVPLQNGAQNAAIIVPGTLTGKLAFSRTCKEARCWRRNGSYRNCGMRCTEGLIIGPLI